MQKRRPTIKRRQGVGREQPGKELERERETTERRRQRKGRMELSGKDRYNPDLIPNLEAYVFTHAHEPQPATTTTVKPR